MLQCSLVSGQVNEEHVGFASGELRHSLAEGRPTNGPKVSRQEDVDEDNRYEDSCKDDCDEDGADDDENHTF